MKTKVKTLLRVMALSLVFVLTAACGANNVEDSLQNVSAEEEICMLTDRQVEILSQLGLPTEYSELEASQKHAITVIEQMLSYLEEKYDMPFVYAGFIAQNGLEADELIAYPESGSSLDQVTVWRTEDGFFADDYRNVASKKQYIDILGGFFEEKLDVPYSLYVEKLNMADAAEGELSFEVVTGKAYGFICNDLTKEELQAIAEAFTVWFQKQESLGDCNLTIYAVNEDVFTRIDEYTYQDALFSEELSNSNRVMCRITPAGETIIR